jgi:hypothetical protein
LVGYRVLISRYHLTAKNPLQTNSFKINDLQLYKFTVGTVIATRVYCSRARSFYI